MDRLQAPRWISPSLAEELQLVSGSLYVGDLHPDVTEEELTQIFETIGPLHSIRLWKDKVESNFCAYINFTSVVAALASKYNDKKVEGKPISVMWYQEEDHEGYVENSLKQEPLNHLKASVCVCDLHPDVTEEKLTNLFGTTAAFHSVHLCKENTDNIVSYAYVNFLKSSDASWAMVWLNNCKLMGTAMRIKGKEGFGGYLHVRSDGTFANDGGRIVFAAEDNGNEVLEVTTNEVWQLPNTGWEVLGKNWARLDISSASLLKELLLNYKMVNRKIEEIKTVFPDYDKAISCLSGEYSFAIKICKDLEIENSKLNYLLTCQDEMLNSLKGYIPIPLGISKVFDFSCRTEEDISMAEYFMKLIRFLEHKEGMGEAVTGATIFYYPEGEIDELMDQLYSCKLVTSAENPEVPVSPPMVTEKGSPHRMEIETKNSGGHYDGHIILRSWDRVLFVVEAAILVTESNFIRALFFCSETSSCLCPCLNISSEILEQIIYYCRYNSLELEEFGEMEPKTLVELILAAKYLCMDGLLNTCNKIVWSKIKGKDEAQILLNFGL